MYTSDVMSWIDLVIGLRFLLHGVVAPCYQHHSGDTTPHNKNLTPLD